MLQIYDYKQDLKDCGIVLAKGLIPLSAKLLNIKTLGSK